MVYPDTPGIRDILKGVPKLTESPSIEGGFWKVKWKGEKDAVLKAMSQANALIGEEMSKLTLSQVRSRVTAVTLI